MNRNQFDFGHTLQQSQISLSLPLPHTAILCQPYPTTLFYHPPTHHIQAFTAVPVPVVVVIVIVIVVSALVPLAVVVVAPSIVGGVPALHNG